MSEYIVTARKWRPMVFEEVVGQSHVTGTLRNAITGKRLAHAYLFSGPRGVGKTTTARLLAKAVNCLHPRGHNPDNECDNCREITEGRSFDVLEIDGASNRGVEEIRNLREAVRYAPTKSHFKVYIIDEVHMLTKEAFNALLKTLEEPPPHVMFIFATTEVHKLPGTILSRCQRFDFRRIAVAEIMANLSTIAGKEGITIDDDALLLVAKRGDGSLRDAQSVFDQVVSLCGPRITHAEILEALNIVDQEMFFRVTDLIRQKDAKAGLALVDELMSRGHDIKDFLTGLSEHFRNLLVARTTGSSALIEASDADRKRYDESAQSFSIPDLLRLQRIANGTLSAIRWNAQPRFKLEADLVQMITMHGAPDVAELLMRIDELKKKLGEEQQSAPATVNLRGQAPPSPPARKPAPPAPSRPETAPVNVISEDELASRWQEFVVEVRKQRISLGSVLDSTTLLGVSGGVIRIGCENEFQASAVTRHKDTLAEFMERLFAVRVRFQAEVVARPAPVASKKKGGEPAGPDQPAEEHPVVTALKRELGAEPL